MNRKETKMSAICEQHLPTLKKLIKYLNIGANSWTKLMDADSTQKLPKMEMIGIDDAEIMVFSHNDIIVGSICVKYLGQDLCEIIGDIDDIDQFVDTVDKLIKNIEV